MEPRREVAVDAEGKGRGSVSETSEIWSGNWREVEVGLERYADGKRPRRGGGEGVSVNIIEGPGPSSVATRVMGTGLLENLGVETCREREGRMEWTEDGRFVASLRSFIEGGLVVSLMEDGLLDVPSEEIGRLATDATLEALSVVERLDIEAGFLVKLNRRSGDVTEEARFEFGLEMDAAFWVGGSDFAVEILGADAVGGGEKGLRGVGSGTLTSFSPVDFFDGGGPLIESP